MANSNEQHIKRNPSVDNHIVQERSLSSSHLTPQPLPFNFSQQHHQQSQRRRTPVGSSPSSTLLQDLLREKKAQSRRVSKAYNSRRRSGKDDGLFGSDDMEFANRRLVQSSPLGPLHAVEVRGDSKEGSSRRQSTTGLKGSIGARGMGAREVDEFISTLHKQNFDLKLELYHRRQRMTELEEQLEQSKELETENEELQEVNEQLLLELEKRDKAVEEAVGIICELEEKVEKLEEELMTETRPSTAQPDTDYLTTEPEESAPPSSPPGTGNPKAPATPPPAASISKKNPSRPGITKTSSSKLIDVSTPYHRNPPASAYRTPSFLTGEDSKSAGALRSLYLAGEEGKGSYSFLTLSRRASGMSRDAPGSPDPNGDGMDSPRLSVLSESSFLSVYGDTRRLDLNADDEPIGGYYEEEKGDDQFGGAEDGVRQSNKQTRVARVEKWIDDRATPSKPSRVSYGRGQFLSIGDVLHNRLHLVDDGKFYRSSPQRESPTFSMREERSRKENIEPMGMTDEIIFGKNSPLQARGETFEPPGCEDEQRSENIVPNGMMSGTIFGQNLLPPTPDTMSTFDRDSYKRSTQSIVREKSLLDGTPGAARSYSALIPQPRPRSADGEGNRDTIPRDWETDMDFNDLASSDGELESMRVEHSEWGQDNDQMDISRLPFFAMMSPVSMRHLDRSTPSKASSEGHRRDLLFVGDTLPGSAGRGELSNSRPTRQGSSTGSARKRSFQHPAAVDRLRSNLSCVESAPAPSPPGLNSWPAEGGGTVTPTRYGFSGNNSPRSPSTPWRDTSTIAVGSSRAPSESKLPRSNLRLHLTTSSLTPSPPKRNSLTSRIFGRGGIQSETNSPSVESPPANPTLHSLFSRSNRPLSFQSSQTRGPRPGTAGSVEGKGGSAGVTDGGGLRNKSSGSTWESESGGEDSMTPKTEAEEFGHGTVGKGSSRSYEDLAEKEQEQEMMSRSLQLGRSKTISERRPAMHTRTNSMVAERSSNVQGGDPDKKAESSTSKRGWLGTSRLGGLRPIGVVAKGVKDAKGKPGQKSGALRKDREDTGIKVGPS
ncbi:MAG: hypothetical protein M1840_007266 [Geoglossum simile]|nr:MAG: hypothetical protein M1840_007266 [Geoglossum simile]